jgi:hypothetical protein
MSVDFSRICRENDDMEFVHVAAAKGRLSVLLYQTGDRSKIEAIASHLLVGGFASISREVRAHYWPDNRTMAFGPGPEYARLPPNWYAIECVDILQEEIDALIERVRAIPPASRVLVTRFPKGENAESRVIDAREVSRCAAI